MKKGDHLFLVDGSGYIFRAYHALPPLTRKSDGLPVGAVSGFCNMLWKLLCSARNTSLGVMPTHFALVFDYSSNTFRKDLYPLYKANRSTPSADLLVQFGLIRQATHAFNLPYIEKEGFEADDIIASYTREVVQAGADVTIFSSDKDLMQLVDDHVSMYDSVKNLQINVPEVVEKWGVMPERMADLQAMTGDTTDNIPGIPGIGPKTAAALIEKFGCLDALLERVDEIPRKKWRENIISHAEQLKISRQLVRLYPYIPLDIHPDTLVLKPQDGTKLIGFLKAIELKNLIRRVAKGTDTNAAAVKTQHVNIHWGHSRSGEKEA
ncbi:MAG: DNA polymerase I [Candidatus Tokpelaia sp. JSC085]|nr:MAG: DNA polymerase I [Candidatus Tokpelaia sp. JSC085]